MSARPAATRATAGWLALAFALLYLATGGGRIVGSDEVTMAELSRSLVQGRIDVPEGATLQGRDGRHYSKNTFGQAVLALPWTLAGEAVSRALPFAPAKKPLVARAVVSTFNAFVTALLVGVFYMAARGLGAGSGGALAAALMLGLTTPLWVYSKSFMAEPLQALGLLLALWGAVRAASADPQLPDKVGERLAGLGTLLAVLVKPSMLPLAVLAAGPLWGRPGRGTLWPLAGLVVGLSANIAYNQARFGSVLETGYGGQASLAAFSTPLWVGVYGLLFSSGKGLLWFAPAVWFVFSGLSAMLRPRAHGGGVPARREAASRAAVTVMSVSIIALVMFGMFEHWAGDGSFGPRYLMPIVPLLMLAVAFSLTAPTAGRRRRAWLVAALALLVQLGGVSIYFGAQMREAGDYPYTRSLSDPLFMSESHFNPRFTPILGHWKMLVRNVDEHIAGVAPRLGGGGEPDPRLGISPEEQKQLLHAIDFWWLYAGYAGIPALPVMALLAVLLASLGFAIHRLRAAWRHEVRAG